MKSAGPEMTTTFHVRVYSRFNKIMRSFRRRKSRGTNQGSKLCRWIFGNRENVRTLMEFRTKRQFDLSLRIDPSIFTSTTLELL